MKAIIYIVQALLLFPCLVSTIPAEAQGKESSDVAERIILAGTLNIRYDNPDDGPNRWVYRKPVIRKYFASNKFDVIGFQEVEKHQLVWLTEILPDFMSFGEGRQDGKKGGGEHCPIFVDANRFHVLDNSQFWLSNTPEIPGSKYWYGNLPRIVTWVKLKEKNTGKIVFVFNTHFEGKGLLVRQMSTDLLSDKISEIAGDQATVLMGDFNIRKKVREGRSPLGKALYYNLIGTLADNNSLENSYSIARLPSTTAGSTGTRRFRRDASIIGPVGDAIDYIFVNDHFRVERYRVDRIMDGEVFISDHWPVVAEIYLTKRD